VVVAYASAAAVAALLWRLSVHVAVAGGIGTMPTMALAVQIYDYIELKTQVA